MPQRPFAADFVLVVAGAAVGSMPAICVGSGSCAAAAGTDSTSATCTVTLCGAAAGAPSAASTTGFVSAIRGTGAPTDLAGCAETATGGCGNAALATWDLGWVV